MPKFRLIALAALVALGLAAHAPQSADAQDSTRTTPTALEQLLTRLKVSGQALDSLSRLADESSGSVDRRTATSSARSHACTTPSPLMTAMRRPDALTESACGASVPCRLSTGDDASPVCVAASGRSKTRTSPSLDATTSAPSAMNATKLEDVAGSRRAG